MGGVRRLGRPVRVRIARVTGVTTVQAHVEALRAQVDELSERLSHAMQALHGHSATLADHAASLRAHGDAIGAQGHSLEGLGNWVADLDKEVSAHRELPSRVGELEQASTIAVFMAWIENARLTRAPLVSVVMPTYNRAGFVRRAIDSVQAQTYRNWELVVVDDASTDETQAVLAGVADDRVRVVRNDSNRGACGARNVGLDAARGEIVAYLDDDNTMHRSWLKSVVWALQQRPEMDLVYGAIVIDDVARVNQLGAGSLPRLFFRPFDRDVLLRENLADISAVAHRAGLPGARFDESLVEMGDWDLLCTLTQERDPLAVPSIACFYTTDAPNRLSGGATFTADAEAVRRKHSAEREPTP